MSDNTMDRDTFLSKIFNLFSGSFTKGNGSAWLDAYRRTLTADIDYDNLYDFVIMNYSGKTAPSPAFLLKNSKIKKHILNTAENQTKTYKTLLADNGPYTYEFTLDCSTFAEARALLESKGLKNVRYKQQTLYEFFEKEE